MASTWYYVINGLTVAFVFIPLIVTLFSSRKRSFSHGLQLFVGILFIVISGLSFAWLTGGLARFESAGTGSEEEVILKADILQAFGVWVFVVPATYLGIEVNLMTNFITKGNSTA